MEDAREKSDEEEKKNDESGKKEYEDDSGEAARKSSMEENFRERYFRELQNKLNEASRRERELVALYNVKSEQHQKLLGKANFEEIISFLREKLKNVLF